MLDIYHLRNTQVNRSILKPIIFPLNLFDEIFHHNKSSKRVKTPTRPDNFSTVWPLWILKYFSLTSHPYWQVNMSYYCHDKLLIFQYLVTFFSKYLFRCKSYREKRIINITLMIKTFAFLQTLQEFCCWKFYSCKGQ